MHKHAKVVENLTNEALNKQGLNQFEIVGKAIKIADYLITSGKVKDEWSDNVANAVLHMMEEKGIQDTEETLLET